MKILFTSCVVFLISSTLLAQGKCDERLSNLEFIARVIRSTSQEEQKIIVIDLKVETTFTNRGREPFIFLKPNTEIDDSYVGWWGGITVYARNPQGDAYPIFENIALPSVCTNCNDKLGKMLDAKVPPTKVVNFLRRGENVTHKDQIRILFSKTTSSGMYGWDEVLKNKHPLLGTITYSLFPSNLESYKRNFGSRLKQRWAKSGILYYCGTHSLISSKRFEIHLTGTQP